MEVLSDCRTGLCVILHGGKGVQAACLWKLCARFGWGLDGPMILVVEQTEGTRRKAQGCSSDDLRINQNV